LPVLAALTIASSRRQLRGLEDAALPRVVDGETANNEALNDFPIADENDNENAGGRGGFLNNGKGGLTM